MYYACSVFKSKQNIDKINIVLCNQLLRLHSAPIPGSNPGDGSDPSCGVSLTRVYTVIPLMEQTPQVGQDERAQVRNFACYRWKSSIHCRGRPSFLFYTHKKQCQTPHAGSGSNPTNLEEHKRRVRPRNRGRWFAFTLRGKRWVWPRMWGSTPQSEHCVNAVSIAYTMYM